MNNIVDLGTGRSRPRRAIEHAEHGARILFFTGVRYVRADDDDTPAFVADPTRFCENPSAAEGARSGVEFELATR